MDWQAGISHTQLLYQLLFQIQTQIEVNIPGKIQQTDGRLDWQAGISHTHLHAAKIQIAEENLVESSKGQVDWQAGISHTPIPAVSLSRRLLAVNTCRHCILNSVKIADYILPRLKDIAIEVEGVKIIFIEQQYEDIFSLSCLEQ